MAASAPAMQMPVAIEMSMSDKGGLPTSVWTVHDDDSRRVQQKTNSFRRRSAAGSWIS